jgi:spermine oxidase
MENGFNDIVILEAENRIGGRVHSVPHSNGFIDLGGQWITGQSNNLIYETYSKYFDFGDLFVGDIEREFLLMNGKLPNENQCERISQIYEKIMDQSSLRMQQFNGSIGEFFTSEYQKVLSSENNLDLSANLTGQLLDYFQRETNLDHGSPSWFDISAGHSARSEKPLGKQAMTWKTEGFKTVFDFISVSKRLFYNL